MSSCECVCLGMGWAVRVNGSSFVSVIRFHLFQVFRAIGSPFPRQHQPPKDKQVLNFEVNVNTSVFQLCWKQRNMELDLLVHGSY